MLLSGWLEGTSKELYERLFTTEFDLDSLKKDLDSGIYDADAVNLAAYEYVDDCTSLLGTEDDDFWAVGPGKTIPGYESSHMTEALELLLNYGLDPNKIFREERKDGSFEEFNIMRELNWVDNGYQGADSLYLLLSHGGNPNLVVDREHLLSEPYFDLWFDTVNRNMLYESVYDAKVHYTMVLIGFGANMGEERNQLDPVGNFDLSRLREHRDYYVGAIHSDKSNDGMELCFFNKHNNWEVARF